MSSNSVFEKCNKDSALCDVCVMYMCSTEIKLCNVKNKSHQTTYPITILIIKITISLIVISLKNSYISTNSLAKLLSDSSLLDSLLLDSLLSDSLVSHSHSKL